MADNWTEHEDRVAVEAYLDMLHLELKRLPFNKTASRREVLPKLNNRTNGSLEFKNCNISAALLRLGYPIIDGYKPRWNFQQSLLGVIEYCLQNRSPLLVSIKEFVNEEAKQPVLLDYLSMHDSEAPNLHTEFAATEESVEIYNPTHTNFLELEAKNRFIGTGGEKLVVSFEKQRLIAAGKESLADRVEHVAATQGDGAGFDIRTFKDNGRDLFIEVKTTRLRKEAPFFITNRELAFSRSRAANYSLYRIYHFDKKPRLFMLPGDISTACKLTPTNYRASF